MTLGIATILSQPMMSRIIFIIKQKIQIASQKAKKLKRKIIREKTIPKAFIQEKKKMCQRRISLKIKRLEKILQVKKFIAVFIKSRRKS